MAILFLYFKSRYNRDINHNINPFKVSNSVVLRMLTRLGPGHEASYVKWVSWPNFYEYSSHWSVIQVDPGPMGAFPPKGSFKKITGCVFLLGQAELAAFIS